MAGPARLQKTSSAKVAVVAPDKFRGTASAAEVAGALAETLESLGYQPRLLPMSDGGEGFLDVFPGITRNAVVTAADWRRISVEYKMNGDTAVIEMAKVAGLTLVGGPSKNEPMTATTRGVGELIKAAAFAGARKFIVGCGGSATTDGGLGAVDVLEPIQWLKGLELVVAVDVDTLFLDAAAEFSPQKGASSAQAALLSARLRAVEQQYRARFGRSISSIRGGGAAGGLAGGLAAVGARIISGFEAVAEENGFYEALCDASLVVTGEGYLDAQSFQGKVVGQVVRAAADRSIQCLVVVGDLDVEAVSHLPDPAWVSSLAHEVGVERAFEDTLASIRETLRFALRSRGL